MEEKALTEGAPRVKFASNYKGTITELLDSGDEDLRNTFHKLSEKLSSALWELEECGATPVCPDGKVAGNAAALLGDEKWVLLSKSGKLGGKKMDTLKDVCIVTKFDMEKWEATYYAESADTIPTSDAPLHFTVLQGAHEKYNWDKVPKAAVHGHALEKAEVAEKLGLPCSHDETLFSTPSDSAALLELMGKYPYPKDDVYIRNGHGFVTVGGDVDGAMMAFREKVRPHISEQDKEK